MSKQFVVIDLSKQKYCMPIELVSAVIDEFSVTRVPNSLRYVQGVSNIRGEILPVVDLKSIFGIEEQGGGHSKLMSVSISGKNVGLMVDSASNVISVEEHFVRDLPSILQSKEKQYFQTVAEIDGELAIVINPSGLFTEEEKAEMFRLKEK